MRFSSMIGLAALGALSGCASTGQADEVGDPLEGFNRKMFAFNDTLDRAVLEPTAKGYRAVTTSDMREGVANALDNLKEPVTFVNQLLQGDIGDAGETVGRFALNSTLGVAGLVDVTGHLGEGRKKEDFGQTLAVWGAPAGPYLVLPFLGSTTPRDLTGTVTDAAFQPLNWAQFEGDDAVRLGRSVAGVISGREAAIEVVEDLRTQQLDPYVAVRRFYVDSRAAAVRNGAEVPDAFENLPDYEEY